MLAYAQDRRHEYCLRITVRIRTPLALCIHFSCLVFPHQSIRCFDSSGQWSDGRSGPPNPAWQRAGKEENMAHYAIRENLRRKLQDVLAKAAAKEGLEMTLTFVSMDEELDVFARCEGTMLLSDGRYVYDVWNDVTKRQERYMVDNVPVAVLKELFACLHDENLQDRSRQENESAQRGAPWQADDARDAWDRRSSASTADSPEAIVIQKLCGDSGRITPADLGALEEDPEIGYTPDGKHFDRQTVRQLRSIALAYTQSLPQDKRQQFDMLYACGAVHKDLAEDWGVSEAAVSKRAHDHIRKASRMFMDLGYPISSTTRSISSSVGT